MTTLFLLRLPVNLAALNRFAAQRGFLHDGHDRLLDEGLVLHHLLSETFGKGALQPFRLLPAPGARQASLYGYSSQGAAGLREMAELTSLPEALDVLQVENLQDKPMPLDKLTIGRRLGFDILLRPVMRAREDGAERDAYQLEAERTFPDQKGTLAASGRTRTNVYLDWLQARLGKAAQLEREASRLARFQRRRVLRNGKLVEGPDALIHGALTIQETEDFIHLLKRGVGRHRAYGYGMLLLRPPSAHGNPAARGG